ncbi:MAG: type II toxin-antitoxin system HicB family antitoxin [Gammaproteobacteria bacterium]|nr:type II toxin-antitoxin system HicB family antitoxin [Gammaproteobacteria bacterium]
MTPRQSIHAVVVESEGLYVAECLEIAIVTQGATLDETLAQLREAVILYMADEDPRTVGVVPKPRLQVTLEVATGC